LENNSKVLSGQTILHLLL